MTAHRVDIVVVGAGFSGLSAAHALIATGLDVIVLEARDRVGGRVASRINGLGERVDTGGQFLCDDMPEVLALARARGKTVTESYARGDFVSRPPVPHDVAERIYAGSVAMRERANEIDPADPGIRGLTVSAWMERQPEGPEIKASFRSMVEGLWCLSADRLPFWYLIDNDGRITNEVSELQYFLAETMHSLADDLAADLGPRLRLATPVTEILHGAGGVEVMTANGPVAARGVVVAVPPMMATRIPFSPALPAPLMRALAAWESGAVVKALIRYDRPFWRDAGLSGTVMWRNPTSLYAFDASPDAKHAMLAFFIGGPRALTERVNGEEALRDFMLARLSEALGPQAATPSDFLLLDWTHDEWSGGAYSDLVVDMQATDAEDVLRRGLPGLVFASSELSPSFPGYVEGAIIAGRVAAGRVMAEIGATAGDAIAPGAAL